MTEVIAVVRLRQLANGQLHDELGEVLLGLDHVHVVFAAVDHRRPALRVPPEHHFWFGVRVHHALESHGVAQAGHGDFRRHQFGHVCNTRRRCFRTIRQQITIINVITITITMLIIAVWISNAVHRRR